MKVFDEATAVRRLGPGRYETLLDKRFAIGGAINGGVLTAAVLRAVIDDGRHVAPSSGAVPVPHEHPVATSTHFLRVPRPDPAEIAIEWRKHGRTAATALASLIQDGRVILDTIVSTGTLPPESSPDWAGPPPELPPVEDCLRFELTPDGAPRGFADQVDLRLDPATAGWLDGRPHGFPEMRGYFRLRDQRDPDAYVLALAVDAMPPVVFGLGTMGWAPTVELTWHMRGVPAPGWLMVRARARTVADGWFDEDAEVYDATGRLVAQGRQIARVGRAAG